MSVTLQRKRHKQKARRVKQLRDSKKQRRKDARIGMPLITAVLGDLARTFKCREVRYFRLNQRGGKIGWCGHDPQLRRAIIYRHHRLSSHMQGNVLRVWNAPALN